MYNSRTFYDHVLPFLSGPAIYHLTQTCAQLRVNIGSFINDFRTIDTLSMTDRFQFAIDESKVALCELIFCLEPFESYYNLKQIASPVGRKGDYNMCALVHYLSVKWGCIDAENCMFGVAAEKGNRALCSAIRHWCYHGKDSRPRYWLSYNVALSYAARGGQWEMCLLLYEWAKQIPEVLHYCDIFYEALTHGHHNIKELVRQWSRVGYGGVMFSQWSNEHCGIMDQYPAL